MKFSKIRNNNGNIICNGYKIILDDGNFKKVAFQASRNHQPLEVVFGGLNSNIIEGEDWQEGDQVEVKIERIPKYNDLINKIRLLLQFPAEK